MIRLKTFIVINALTELIFKRNINTINYRYFQKFLLESNSFRLPNHKISLNDLSLIFDFILKNNYLTQNDEGDYNPSRSKLSNVDYFYIFADKFQKIVLFQLDNFLKFLYKSKGYKNSQDYIDNFNYGVLLLVLSGYNFRLEPFKEIVKLRFIKEIHKAFENGLDNFIEYVKNQIKTDDLNYIVNHGTHFNGNSNNSLNQIFNFYEKSNYSIQTHRRKIVFDLDNDSFIDKYSPPIIKEDYFSKLKDQNPEDPYFDSDFEVDLGYLEDLKKK